MKTDVMKNGIMKTSNQKVVCEAGRWSAERGGINWGLIGLLLFVAAVAATVYGFYQIDPSHININGRSGDELSFFEVVLGAIAGVIGLIIGLIAGLIGLIVGLLGAALGLFIALGVVAGPVLLLIFTIWIFTRGGKRDPVEQQASASDAVADES